MEIIIGNVNFKLFSVVLGLFEIYHITSHGFQ